MFQNVASIHSGHKMKYIYEAYRNEVYLNVRHINYGAYDAESYFRFSCLMSEQNIPQWDFILNCCSSCLGVKILSLEMSKIIENDLSSSGSKKARTIIWI